jgi:hypothetical protein
MTTSGGTISAVCPPLSQSTTSFCLPSKVAA